MEESLLPATGGVRMAGKMEGKCAFMTDRENAAIAEYVGELNKAVFSDEFLANMGMSRDLMPFMGLCPEKAGSPLPPVLAVQSPQRK
ncbi:hypothetical protein FACS1894106_1370 [Spirochaetia bacterium]|nr:hypothetical protein FACS1894106_1370 [Spirochaetia bacterium]